MPDERPRRALPILVAVLLMPSAIPIGGDPVQTLQFEPTGLYSHVRGPEFDAAGRTVRNGARRFNYLPGATATESLQIELDGEGNTISTRTVMAAGIAQSNVVSSSTGWNQSAALPQVCGVPLKQEWQEALWGSGIGATHIVLTDLDADGTAELVMGASSTDSARNDFFYVLRSTSMNDYTRLWVSALYGTSGSHIQRITKADLDSDGLEEILIGISNQTIEVYGGTPFTRITTISSLGTWAIEVADLNGDGKQEIVTSDGILIYVYSGISPYALKWQTAAYGGYDLAVGNVDGDKALEIVTPGGQVIDGVSHKVEWSYPDGFGIHLDLANIDSDSMLEIIGAAFWQKVAAFDADIKSVKWSFLTTHDISALRTVDTDGDGRPEVLVGDGQWGYVACHSGITGAPLWSIRNPEHGVTDIAYGDIDNDGANEVVWGAGWTTTGPDYLHVSDVLSATIEWQSENLDGPIDVAVGDVNDDGRLEIITANYQSENGYNGGLIRVFDALTHQQMWRSQPSNTNWMGTRAVEIGDVNDDGHPDLVFGSSDYYEGFVVIKDSQALGERRTSSYPGNPFTAIAIGDVDGDGATDIVTGQGRAHTGTDGAHIVVFDGADYYEKWRSIALGIFWGHVYDIELADIDGDGRTEIIASVNYGTEGMVYVFDGVTHETKWVKDMEAYGLATGDLDDDTVPEIIVGRAHGVIEVYEGRTFTLQNTVTVGKDPVYGILLSDVDGDGETEWLVNVASSLVILDGAAGGVKSVTRDLGFNPGLYGNTTVKDLDGDGDNEIVLASNHAVFQLELPSITNRPPSASAGGPYRARMASQILFDASASFDPEGAPLTFLWDFESDGKIDLTSPSPKITQAFTTFGGRTASLYVTDGSGACGRDSAEVDIGTNGSPFAHAAGQYTALIDQPVKLDASGSGDPEHDSISYEWDFEADGVFDWSGNGPTTTHVYSAPGRVVARLRVTDEFGATNTDVATVSVSRAGLIVRTPNGGELFHSSQQVEVLWQVGASARLVKVFYSRNNKKSWTLIADDLDAPAGVYTWSIPVVAEVAPKSFVKVVGYNEKGVKLYSDVSDKAFTISP